MIRTLYRDLTTSALALVPWNLLAAGAMLIGGLLASASGSGLIAYIALVLASCGGGVAAAVLFANAAVRVESGRVRLRDTLRVINRTLVVRGVAIGLGFGALPVVIVGQLHVALESGEVALLAAALTCIVIMVGAVPFSLVLVPALCAYPGRSMPDLLSSSLATVAAAPRHHVKVAAAVVLLGAVSSVTIAPMFTVFIACTALVGARLVVLPLSASEAHAA